MPGSLWQGSFWSFSRAQSCMWIGHRCLVIRPNFGGDIQLGCVWRRKGLFFASARVHRWAAGSTDAWAALVDASGAMASAPVPVWGLPRKPCTAASQVFFVGWCLSPPESLVKLLHSCFHDTQTYTELHRITQTCIRGMWGSFPKSFERWGGWVDINTADKADRWVSNWGRESPPGSSHG